MAEHEMIKVYELAKELGLTPLNLLDKLNDLNIKVKSHMSELSLEQVEAAKNSLLGKKSASAASPAKKTSSAAKTRKKTETAPPSAPAPAATTPAPVAAAPAAGKDAASPIIRRRSKADGASDTPVTRAHQTVSDEAHAISAEDAAPVARAAHTTPAPTMESETAEVQETAHKSETATVATLAQETPVAAPVSAQPAKEAAPSRSVLKISMPSAPKAPEVKPEAPSVQAAPARSQEVHTPAATATPSTAPATPAAPSAPVAPPAASAAAPAARASIILPPRPSAPRRSVLTVVAPTTPTKPVIIKPAPPAGSAPARTPVKPRPGLPTSSENEAIRISRAPKGADGGTEDENAKKRGGAREAEIRPEDVKFADYRKKEMVFLPKKKRLPSGKALQKTQITTPKAIKRVIDIEGTITVSNLAAQLGVKAIDVIRKLMAMGEMATVNQSLDFDTASLIATEYQYEARNVEFKEASFIDESKLDTEESKSSRPPIVTIMGHVDHGKTSLLDALREANVAAGEAGGITQHIGAYTVEKDGNKITFIDTPGHEAFTVMRARGANVTDIVILVVAADDGVMPQTREALNHAKAAKVPIIVAMNKIDKPGANPEKIKQQLAELDLLAEDWGGQTMFVPVSAIKRTNLDKLLESILIQAEVLELKANPEPRASGTVLEARLERGRGAVVSLLVSRGTLRVGDAIVAGLYSGRIKAMMDHLGRSVKEVSPGMAAEVLGFEGVPGAGERFDCTATETDAREIAENRQLKARQKTAGTVTGASGGKVSLEDLFSKIQTGSIKELGVILKADVYGSVEAIRDSLVKLSTEKVKVKVIHAAPGGITESDVLLATASKAIILGFNVRPETKARQLAEAEHIEIKSYTIIYELLDDMKKAMTGLLDKKKVERFVGRAEVRQTFSVPKIGVIAGCGVIDGKMLRGANVRLLRDSRVIFDGKMSSLRRFKDDAKEVATGFECGIGIENYNDLKPGDIIEAYQIDLIAPELS
jgi:translation initiation factor IF-2